MPGDGKERSPLRPAPDPRMPPRRWTAAAARCRVAAARCGFRTRARCPATATSARGARRTGPTATELRSAIQRGLLIGADSMAALLSMRPPFEPGATSLTARKPSLACIEALQRIEHVVVHWTNVSFLFIERIQLQVNRCAHLEIESRPCLPRP